MQNISKKFRDLLVFFVSAQLCSPVWMRECQSQCRCPDEPPVCPPGSRLTLDDCACCLECTRQKGDRCSETKPCDTRQGLRCEYTGNVRNRTGVCVERVGDICLLGGSVYQSGETFSPSCKYQCVCQDGQVGCVPRCDLHVMLPGPDCPFPRRVQVPRECCHKWECEPLLGATVLAAFAMASYGEEETVGLEVQRPSLNCVEQTTEWGACSRTCGPGTSTQVTNKNRRCEMVKQGRLCIIRPCDQHWSLSKKENTCVRAKRTPKPTHFSFRNCSSVRAYRPLYCGSCSDGHCCTPHSARTTRLLFHCPGGKSLRKRVMFVDSCVCHRHCPQDGST